MVQSEYIEDVFLNFYDTVSFAGIPIQSQDRSAAQSFYVVIGDGTELTQNQANYILKILQKYSALSAMHGYDYSKQMAAPKWRTTFRMLDLSKRVSVEKDSEGCLWVNMKFPYHLKNAVESAILKGGVVSRFDYEAKVRKISLYDANLIHIHEFAETNGFEIDESFLTALAEIEEIWQNQTKILPRSIISNNTVELVNANENATEYWLENKTGNIENDLLLAKSMGFLLDKKAENIIERIASTKPSTYWVKTNSQLLELCKNVDGKVCIILDRVGNSLEWLKEFEKSVDQMEVDRSLVKVCFRADKSDPSNLNEWIKTSGFGGNVNEGKFLIFNHKPAKWLFKEPEHVKILVSNNLYPSTNGVTRDWFNSHSLVIYVGNIKPSEQRNQNIVEL